MRVAYFQNPCKKPKSWELGLRGPLGISTLSITSLLREPQVGFRRVPLSRVSLILPRKSPKPKTLNLTRANITLRAQGPKPLTLVATGCGVSLNCPGSPEKSQGNSSLYQGSFGLWVKGSILRQYPQDTLVPASIVWFNKRTYPPNTA